MELTFDAQQYFAARRTLPHFEAADTIPAQRGASNQAFPTALLNRFRASMRNTFSGVSACEIVEGVTLLAAATCASAFMVAALSGSVSLG